MVLIDTSNREVSQKEIMKMHNVVALLCDSHNNFNGYTMLKMRM